MKRFHSFLSQDSIHEFKTYLPIQLDGTCNGFQHLALLSNETEIFGKLNLLESTKDNDPEDFYKHILEKLTIYIEKALKKIEIYDFYFFFPTLTLTLTLSVRVSVSVSVQKIV